MSVYRIYVEKKPPYSVEGQAALSDLHTALQIFAAENVRVINRYDAENISEENFKKAIPIVFSEPPLDDVYYDLNEIPKIVEYEHKFASEFLPGQFDQRADSAEQCVSMLCGGNRPLIKYTKIYLIKGNLSVNDFGRIKKYLINNVEARECGFEEYKTLKINYDIPTEVAVLEGFINLDETGLKKFISDYALAMDLDDIKFCQEYFRKESREPTITEIRMIDTYWSDHCRHTTFGTVIDKVDIKSDYINSSYKKYLSHKAKLGRSEKPVCLMDIATAAMRKLKADGLIPDLDESEEINACSVKINVDVDGKEQDWLLMFKNETHNHPTEIEPFGGAATCLGGAIRDPLSGRSFVYQAMRVTGSSDPLLPVNETISGKLPPRKITTTAAAGYSSYGNQIGLPTGHVAEIYDPGYMAKRLEIGAVIGAVPAENVVRTRPAPGDIIILLGGRTGRDGCGGATGSSKSHNLHSLEKSGAEVQKGNAPEERKLQRLFRNPEATRLIKRCNDFGAGGVSVAVGELADGLLIDLNKVPKKYDGLDGTELAISESQERMAVVVDKSDADKFIKLASSENLEATIIAEVREEPRLKMNWNGKTIVDISREFLNSNGAEKHTEVIVHKPLVSYKSKLKNTNQGWEKLVTDINICSQRGLVQRFCSSVGAATVLMPFGGKTQQTPTQAMAAKIPVLGGETKTASIMTWGFNPTVSKQSPYHGAALAVVESVAKLVAAGGKSKKVRLSFQEYFERTKNKPERWGKPFAALLGAYEAQIALGIPSIGGKDSMSGTFEDIDVPPTLVSFAVATDKTDNIISAEFKKSGSKILLITPKYDKNYLPDYNSVKKTFERVECEIERKNVISAWALTGGGVAEAVFKMSLGNRIGAKLSGLLHDNDLFDICCGAFVLEANEEFDGATLIGETTADYTIKCGETVIDISEYEQKWNNVLELVFKNTQNIPYSEEETAEISYKAEKAVKLRCAPANKTAKPRVLIPVFPGSNGEYDMAEAFRRAGGETEIFVIRNLTPQAIEESIAAFADSTQKSQIIALVGGFSAGDEPEGSGKFINAFFRNERVKDAVHNLLKQRDGLMLGICNGFQALIKLGLVPFGEIRETAADCPTLTFNSIGRHQSQLVNIKVCTGKSPWLSHCKNGEIYGVPISHGEGRFVADKNVINGLIKNGQIVSRYVDLSGKPTMEPAYNPNGSMYAVEGIISPDGRVLGKMGHTERISADCAKNVESNKNMPLFKAGVDYFL